MYAPEARSLFHGPVGGAASSRETSVSVCVGDASCWREYARSLISLNQRLQKVALRRATSCVNYFRSSCFFETFGRKIEPRTICASLARRSEQQSIGSRAVTLLTTRKSPRSSAANTASSFSSTSWAMPDRLGSRRSAKPRTSARCVGKSQNSNAGSHRWKWASNKEAA